MNIRLHSVTLSALLLATTTTRAADSATTLPAILHLPIMPIHDPFILPDPTTHTYYLYTSNVPAMSGDSHTGIMAYTSKDLLNWSPPIVVFTVPDNSWADPKARPWAPEVHLYRGKYYLLTTLHNQSKILAQPPDVPRTTYMRGTTISVSDSPAGPFTLLKTDAPVPPSNFMTLDGTLFVDPDGTPWMVYAHEWIQKTDGTMEAVPLTPDLSTAAGPPIYLFKASDAPWLDEQATPTTKPATYVTDGPELYRTNDNHLLMLWSSYDKNGYVQTVARSKTGKLQGPWQQLPPLLGNESGHGMLFHSFDGQLLYVCHRPFITARGKLYDIQDAGDHLELGRERTDLDEAK